MGNYEHQGDNAEEALQEAKKTVDKTLSKCRVGEHLDRDRAECIVERWNKANSTDYGDVKMFNEPPTPEEILAAFWEWEGKTRGGHGPEHQPSTGDRAQDYRNAVNGTPTGDFGKTRGGTEKGQQNTQETPEQSKDRVTKMLKGVESQLKELWFGIEGDSMIMPNWEKLPLDGTSESIHISKERSPDGNTYIDVTNTDGSKDRLTLSKGADGKEPGVYLDGQLYSTSDLLSKQASHNYKPNITSGPEPKAHFTGKMRGE